MEKLSCTIIVKNELENLKKLLPKLEWVDEIIIVDSGSIDGTSEFLNQWKGRVSIRSFHRDFDGFGAQKRFAVAQTSHDWVLSLDADEIPTPGLVQEIMGFLKNPNSYVGADISFVNVFLGKEIHLFGSKSHHLRLFNKKFGNYNEALVHELIEVNGPVLEFKNSVLHYSYKSIAHYFEKFNKYTTMGAEVALNKKSAGSIRKVGILELSLRIKVKFIALYFFRLGFRAGYPGFVWCLFSAFYPAVKYMKMNELIEKQNLEMK